MDNNNKKEYERHKFTDDDIMTLVKHINQRDNIIKDLVNRVTKLEEAVESLSSEIRTSKFKDNLNFRKKSIEDIINDK